MATILLCDNEKCPQRVPIGAGRCLLHDPDFCHRPVLEMYMPDKYPPLEEVDEDYEMP